MYPSRPNLCEPPEPLRVTHVTLSLDVGGLERNIVNQVREGSRLGQQVSVVCLERPGALAAQAEALGAKVICLHKSPGLRPEMIGRMRRALEDLRPHVAHTHQIASLLYTGLAAAAKVPVVVHTEHGKERYADRLKTRWLGRIAGRFASRFYCLSHDMAVTVKAHHIVPPGTVRVILNGIDTACFRNRCDVTGLRLEMGIPVGAPVIGTVGRLTFVKRQDLLIRAFARVRERIPEAHLVLVGDGPLRKDLERLATDLRASEVIHFTGYQAEPQHYLQLIDVFALTSASEGIPQALLEASAAGIPAIASRVGGVPEVIDHGRTGILFPSGDLEALNRGLLVLLSNTQLARGLGEAARDRVESLFHIGRMATDYHNQFLELLARKRSRREQIEHGYQPRHLLGRTSSVWNEG
jgi:glycosyltransferase involved in cell wall biosynthesis